MIHWLLAAHAADAEALFATFAAEYEALDPPMEPIVLSYADNFAAIPAPEVLAERRALLDRTRRALRQLDAASPDERYQADVLAWEVGFGLRRLRLEAGRRPETLPTDGLHDLPHGRRWYRLYLQRWTSDDVGPRRLLALGNADVARITGEIAALQDELGYAGRDAEFAAFRTGPGSWQTDEAAVQASFRELEARMDLGRVFASPDVPPLQIARWEEATRDTPPGYWADGTFHYTFFEGRFPVRTTEWLFLHEAVPGHHFQANTGVATPLLDLFWYPGFAEGWGAYAEDLGREIGAFADPWQYLGKWEWDLVRSARVVLDVKIHAHGWTRDQALAWWHEHLPGQEGIAEREVDRVIRWPAQVVSYKVGEHAFLDLRALAESHGMDVRQFHTLVLSRGSLPLPVLEEVVADAIRR